MGFVCCINLTSNKNMSSTAAYINSNKFDTLCVAIFCRFDYIIEPCHRLFQCLSIKFDSLTFCFMAYTVSWKCLNLILDIKHNWSYVEIIKLTDVAWGLSVLLLCTLSAAQPRSSKLALGVIDQSQQRHSAAVIVILFTLLVTLTIWILYSKNVFFRLYLAR